MHNNNSITVLIPCRNEEKYIGRVLDSILSQSYDQKKIEVLVIDGSSDDKTREIVEGYSKSVSNIILLDNPMRTVPYALNLGIKKANGDVIIRMDAHAEYPINYISVLVENLFKLGADNVGGIVQTLPIDGSLNSISIAAALGSPFGVGNSHFRIGSNNVRQVDTVPFGCYRRKVFDTIGLYDEDLIRNQDDELNGRLIKNGGKIYLIPEVVINYYARSKVSKIALMFYQYGLFKPLVNKKLGSPATLRQFFPLLFVVGLILGLILSFVGKAFLIIYSSVLASYILLSIYFSFIEVLKQKNFKLIFLLPYLFFVIHLSYGWGYIMGIIRFLILGNTKSNIKISR